MNINPFLFNSIINAKAKHLGRNHQFIYCQLPDGKIIKAYALTHVSSVNVSVVKFEGNYYCFCGSAPVELSRSTKQLGVRVKRQIKEQSLLFLLIDITKSLENDGVLQAINYINTHNYQFYQYLSFGDITGYISEPLNKTNILIELQDYYENYNPDYDDDFYHSEGTDLPENGIDALNDAILSIDNKYLVDLYLVTDNSKYSRNTSEPEDILSLINSKINKLFINIIQPKNVPSEHIIIQGSETNPYCSNSAITTVLVNDVKVGNYTTPSTILKTNTSMFSWEGGGEGKQHILSNYITEEQKAFVFPKRNVSFPVSLQWQYNQEQWNYENYSFNQSKPFIGFTITYSSPNVSYYNNGNLWTIINNGTAFWLDVFAIFGDYNMGIDFFSPSVFTRLLRPRMVMGSRFDLIINDINTSQWEVVIEDDNTLFYYDMTEPHIVPVVPKTNGTVLENYIYKYLQQTLVTESQQLSLLVNNQVVQSLEETDVVKAICQPQIVPLIEPNSTLYTTSLPPSNKIVYLD